MMSAPKILLIAAISFIIGAVFRSYYVFDFFWCYVLLLACIVALVLSPKDRRLGFLAVAGIFFCLGVFRYHASLPRADEFNIHYYNGRRVTFIGIVVGEPDQRIDRTKLTVKTSEIIINGAAKPVKGNVLVTVNLYPQFSYGDQLKIAGELLAPEPFNGFSYDRYLSRYDIYSLCYFPQMELFKTSQGNKLFAAILLQKNHLLDLINKSLTEPYASMLSALILGNRRGIPQEIINNFSRTGLVHLIAISGMNIALIINILLKILPYFYINRRYAFYLVTAFLVFYMVIIGFPASAVRAAIMGWLVLWATHLGRMSQSSRTLVIAAGIMVLINPKIIRDDVGFQLSFMSMIGLIYIMPLFEHWFRKLPSFFGTKETMSMTLAAQAMTLPIVVYNFGTLSLVAPLANIVVLPIIPYLMIAGFAALALGLLSYHFSWIVFLPVWGMLAVMVRATELFSDFPLAAVQLETNSPLFFLFAYGAIVYLYYRTKKYAKIA